MGQQPLRGELRQGGGRRPPGAGGPGARPGGPAPERGAAGARAGAGAMRAGAARPPGAGAAPIRLPTATQPDLRVAARGACGSRRGAGRQRAVRAAATPTASIMSQLLLPCWLRRVAAPRPVGPAPTTSTSTCGRARRLCWCPGAAARPVARPQAASGRSRGAPAPWCQVRGARRGGGGGGRGLRGAVGPAAGWCRGKRACWPYYTRWCSGEVRWAEAARIRACGVGGALGRAKRRTRYQRRARGLGGDRKGGLESELEQLGARRSRAGGCAIRLPVQMRRAGDAAERASPPLLCYLERAIYAEPNCAGACGVRRGPN